MSARKSSHRTIFLIVSSGSPLALIASSLRSTSKKPVCPMTRSLHPPMAHCRQRVRFATTWREEFFEVPLRQYRSVELTVRSTVITGVAGRRPLPHQHKGVCYAFSLDRNPDHCRHRCDLFLGHRKICQGWPFGKPAQIAGGADLLGGN